MEIKVRWQTGRDKNIIGSHAEYRGSVRRIEKIIFPKRGEEAGCCLKAGHYQRCRIVRDTQPNEPRRGAVIVEIVEECPTCLQQQSILSQLGEGWTASGAHVTAPDGQTVYIDGATFSLEREKQRYAHRARRESVHQLLLSMEWVESARALSYPEGEPIAPQDTPWAEPVEFEGVTFPNLPRLGIGERGNCYPAVHHAKGFGFAWKTPTYEYLSDDEMGMRSGGGNMVFSSVTELRAEHHNLSEETLAELEASASDPKVAEAQTKLADLVASRDIRKSAYDNYVRDFAVWWKGLSTEQRLRVALNCEGGLVAKLGKFGIEVPSVGKRSWAKATLKWSAHIGLWDQCELRFCGYIDCGLNALATLLCAE